MRFISEDLITISSLSIALRTRVHKLAWILGMTSYYILREFLLCCHVIISLVSKLVVMMVNVYKLFPFHSLIISLV